jgi:alkylation response protein AidB-like acyl-CoA dehydrogenase
VIQPLIQAGAKLSPGIESALVVIAASAETSDQIGVPRSHIDLLASAGAHGTARQLSQQREVTERLSGADASTWFCWTQHQTPLRTMLAGGNQAASTQLCELWLPGLQSGELLAAIAFAHVRRGGAPNPVAVKVDGGWELTGQLDWVSSWDIADVLMLLAATEDKSQFVIFYLPIPDFADKFQQCVIGEPLKLLAMSGTHSRPITFDRTYVCSDYVFSIIDANEWLQADAEKTVLPNPAALGVARAAIEQLNEVSTTRKGQVGQVASQDLAHEFERLRAQAYAATDDSSTPRAELISLRVQILEFAVKCTVAVITASSGSAMMSGNAAERRVREAMFLQVQAQTEEMRNAALSRLVAPTAFGAISTPSNH